jgi:uncharacterized protein YqgC (DUF456 family)
MSKRVIYGLIIGAILGIFCIVGASLRMPGELSTIYLFSFWFNRLLMGLVIGLFSRPKNIKIGLLRGVFLGAFVSFAFYSATEFKDLMGFLAGVVYGIIIETVLFYTLKDSKTTT